MSGKKSKVPVQLDIGNMLATLEKKQQSQKAKQDSKPVILSSGLWMQHSNLSFFYKTYLDLSLYWQLVVDFLLSKSNL